MHNPYESPKSIEPDTWRPGLVFWFVYLSIFTAVGNLLLSQFTGQSWLYCQIASTICNVPGALFLAWYFRPERFEIEQD